MPALTTSFASGTLGTRPAAAAGNTGRYYWATDTKQLFQSDGAAWNQLAAAKPQLQTLTDQATLAWDLNLGDAVVTIGASRTMGAPTNLQVGKFSLRVIQGGAGSFTITWNAVFKWAASTAPTLTTTAAHSDLLTFFCDGTNLYQVSVVLNFT